MRGSHCVHCTPHTCNFSVRSMEHESDIEGSEIVVQIYPNELNVILMSNFIWTPWLYLVSVKVYLYVLFFGVGVTMLVFTLLMML